MAILSDPVGKIPLKTSKIATDPEKHRKVKCHWKATMIPYGTNLGFLKTLDHPYYICSNLSPTDHFTRFWIGEAILPPIGNRGKPEPIGE